MGSAAQPGGVRWGDRRLLLVPHALGVDPAEDGAAGGIAAAAVLPNPFLTGGGAAPKQGAAAPQEHHTAAASDGRLAWLPGGAAARGLPGGLRLDQATAGPGSDDADLRGATGAGLD